MKYITKFGLHIICNYLTKGDKKRLKELKENPLIKTIKDISYIDDNKREHLLDIHFPVKEIDNGITIIDIHGGGYMYGYKENNFYFCQELAKKGFKVISVNYSLSNNKINVKDVIRELFTAINFIYENKNEFGVDMDNVCIMGDSAGGHFALLFALALNYKEVRECLGIKFDIPMQINKVITSSPVYDYSSLCEDMRKKATKRALKFLAGKEALFDSNYPLICCPRTWIKKIGDVNFEVFVSTCKEDFLREHPLLLKEDLKEKATIYDPITATKLEHIFPIVKPDTLEAKKCIELINEFILKAL